MRKRHAIWVSSILVAASLFGAAAAEAQTTTTGSAYGSTGSSSAVPVSTATVTTAPASMATMPALYDQNGKEVNASNSTPLAAGWYYLDQTASASSKVYYYGNGVYYDPQMGIYGGSAVNDPNGTAGTSLGYAASVTSSPGLPNTGAGGLATENWLALAASGLVMFASAAYVAGHSSLRRRTAVRY